MRNDEMTAVDSTPLSLDPLELRLLDALQQDFPLSPRPYADIAAEFGVGEQEVLAAFRRLQAQGVLSRIGAVYRPHRVGTSSLAAMSVPPDRLQAVADLVSDYAEVNHNYQREHEWNLWFVATATDPEVLEAVFADIERRTGLVVLRLPMLEDYHIDLGFSLSGESRGPHGRR